MPAGGTGPTGQRNKNHVTPDYSLTPPLAPIPRPPTRRPIAMRLLLSLLIGVFIEATQLLVTWNVTREPSPGIMEFQLNRHGLSLLGRLLKEDRESGRDPAESIEQLRLQHPELQPQFTVDAWGNPFLLQTSQDGVRVMTLGRDHQPGGFGLDADISTDRPAPNAARLTLRQFLFEIDSQPVWNGALVSALLAGLLTWRELRPSPLGEISWGTAFLVVLAWICVSVVVAPAIGFLEIIPNGH